MTISSSQNVLLAASPTTAPDIPTINNVSTTTLPLSVCHVKPLPELFLISGFCIGIISNVSHDKKARPINSLALRLILCCSNVDDTSLLRGCSCR